MPAPILDSAKSSLYKTALSQGPDQRVPLSERAKWAQVAQLVEHCTENAGVGGSIPPLGTIKNSKNFLMPATHARAGN
jgi:hypothetical protein